MKLNTNGQLTLLIINTAAVCLDELLFATCGMHPCHKWITVIMHYSMFFCLNLLVGTGPDICSFQSTPEGKGKENI